VAQGEGPEFKPQYCKKGGRARYTIIQDAHQHMNGQIKCGTYTQWNITHT
jgi:hypothetical protein